MSYTRTTTINAAPGGDSVKQAVLDLDTDLTGAFTHLNTVQSDVDDNQVATDAHASATAAHGATGAVVGTTDTQTLTNKTLNLTSNTLTGTVAQFNTALSDGDFVTLAGTETLTNKTISSPTVSGGTINNTAIGSTTPSTGVFTTLSATGAVQLATSTGNLLIGTTFDDGINKLQVNGGISASGVSSVIANSSNAYTPQFLVGDSISPTTGKQLWLGYNTTADYGYIQAAHNGTAYTALAVNSLGGNLLIGTTTDDGVNKLQVNGGISFVKTVTNPGAFSPTHKVPITINGITYYMALTTS